MSLFTALYPDNVKSKYKLHMIKEVSLVNKQFYVRGIIRNPEPEKARELSELVVEIVQADGGNKEQMLKAFEGS